MMDGMMWWTMIYNDVGPPAASLSQARSIIIETLMPVIVRSVAQQARATS